MEAAPNRTRAFTVERGEWFDVFTGDRASLMALPECPAGIFDGGWKASRTIKLPDGRKARVSGKAVLSAVGLVRC